MTTVQEITAAIQKLPPSERAEVERLLHGEADDAWDRQMAADAQAGKLARLLGQVDAHIGKGNLQELP